LNQADLFVTEGILREVYDQPDAGLGELLKHILGSARLRNREDEARDAFDAYVAEHSEFSATQLNFLRTVRGVVVQGMRVTADSLEALPFSRVGDVHRLFSDKQVTEILELTRRLAG